MGEQLIGDRDARRLEQYTRAQRGIAEELAKINATSDRQQANANQAENKTDPQSPDVAHEELTERKNRFAAMDALVREIVLAEAPFAQVVTDVCNPRSQWSGESFAWWINAGGIEETARMLTSNDHRWDLETLRQRIGYSCASLVKRYGASKLGKVESETDK